MIDDILLDTEDRMNKAVEATLKEFGNIRTRQPSDVHLTDG